jgi:hypothetical protein
MKSDIDIIACVDLYELGYSLNIPQLCFRILNVVNTVLTTINFDTGYKRAFNSPYNENDGLDPLLSIFQNFYFEKKSEIVTDLKKTLALVKCKVRVPFGDDQFITEIKKVKKELWTSKKHADITLVCKDGVVLSCHQAILALSPLFVKFNSNMDLLHYNVEWDSKPLVVFLELLYLQTISIENVGIPELMVLYHLLKQSCMPLYTHVADRLKKLIDSNNVKEILDFYISSGLSVSDPDFSTQLLKCMKGSTLDEFCRIYLACDAAESELLGEVVKLMTSTITTETSSAWLATLDEHGIDNPDTWNKLGKNLPPVTLHLWNIFQAKIAKGNTLMDKMPDKMEVMEQEKKEILDRLVRLESLVLLLTK